MRTARPFSETRERLCEVAQRLMVEKGYPATSIDEICALAGVTKGSFFHYFNSKDHLGRELLERYLATRMAEHEALAMEPDPLRRLYGHLDAMIRRAGDPANVRGSLLGIFAQELCATNPEIGQRCAEAFRRWADQMAGDLDEAQALYPPRLPVASRSLADHFVAVVEGSLILARVRDEPRIMQQNLRHFRDYVEMLLGPAPDAASTQPSRALSPPAS